MKSHAFNRDFSRDDLYTDAVRQALTEESALVLNGFEDLFGKVYTYGRLLVDEYVGSLHARGGEHFCVTFSNHGVLYPRFSAWANFAEDQTDLYISPSEEKSFSPEMLSILWNFVYSSRAAIPLRDDGVSSREVALGLFRYDKPERRKKFIVGSHPDHNVILFPYAIGEPLEIKLKGRWVHPELAKDECMLVDSEIEHRVADEGRSEPRYSILVNMLGI